MLNRYGLVDPNLLDLVEENERKAAPITTAFQDLGKIPPDFASHRHPASPMPKDAVTLTPEETWSTHSHVGLLGNRAAQELNKESDKTGLHVGRSIGVGARGSVHETNIPNYVVKFDTGIGEHALANHILHNPSLYQGISVLPKYYKVHDTNVFRSFSFQPGFGRRVRAIHREDLPDVPYEDRSHWGWLGGRIEAAREEAFDEYKHDTKNGGNTPLHDYIVRHINNAMDDAHQSRFKGKELEPQFNRVRSDIQKLVSLGIVPCDIHASNWGIRPKTGEVVMRDVGCYFVHKPEA